MRESPRVALIALLAVIVACGGVSKEDYLASVDSTHAQSGWNVSLGFAARWLEGYRDALRDFRRKELRATQYFPGDPIFGPRPEAKRRLLRVAREKRRLRDRWSELTAGWASEFGAASADLDGIDPPSEVAPLHEKLVVRIRSLARGCQAFSDAARPHLDSEKAMSAAERIQRDARAVAGVAAQMAEKGYDIRIGLRGLIERE